MGLNGKVLPEGNLLASFCIVRPPSEATIWQVFIVRQCGGRQWREVSGGD